MVKLAKRDVRPPRGSFHDLARQVDRYFSGRCPTIRTRPVHRFVAVEDPEEENA